MNQITDIDYIGRTQIIQNLNNLTLNSFQHNYAPFIMLDGEWGCGKSFILNSLEAELKTNSKILTINYNAWELSYYEDPLYALVDLLLSNLSIFTEEDKKKYSSLKTKLIKGIGLFDLAPGVQTGPLREMLEELFLGNINETDYSRIASLKNKINSPNRKKMVLLVDELDRCLPEYGIKVLERLYMLLKNISDVVVVICNNNTAFENSIKQIFGNQVSPIDYQKKFIDYRFRIMNNTETASNHFNVLSFKNKYQYFFNKFEIPNDNSEVNDLLTLLFENKNARENDRFMKKCVTLINLASHITDVQKQLWELFFILILLNNGINTLISDIVEKKENSLTSYLKRNLTSALIKKGNRLSLTDCEQALYYLLELYHCKEFRSDTMNNDYIKFLKEIMNRNNRLYNYFITPTDESELSDSLYEKGVNYYNTYTTIDCFKY